MEIKNFRIDTPDLGLLGRKADPKCKIYYGTGYYVIAHICFGPDPHNEYATCRCTLKGDKKNV